VASCYTPKLPCANRAVPNISGENFFGLLLFSVDTQSCRVDTTLNNLQIWRVVPRRRALSPDVGIRHRDPTKP